MRQVMALIQGADTFRTKASRLAVTIAIGRLMSEEAWIEAVPYEVTNCLVCVPLTEEEREFLEFSRAKHGHGEERHIPTDAALNVLRWRMMIRGFVKTWYGVSPSGGWARHWETTELGETVLRGGIQ